MDFTPELSAFQGVIISADNVHPFSRLTEKGGNEEKITAITNNILKFLQDKKIIDDGPVDNMITQVRKFALYIVLNANLRTLETLVEIEEIDLVIWTIPTIPKLLMCEFIYNLRMEQFLYEVVVFSYPPLALEVSAAFLDHLKYSVPTNCLDKLRKLSLACYTLVCRLHLFNFQAHYSKILIDAKNNFEKCLKYITEPPNSGKLLELQKNDLYKYKGKHLTSALLCVYECVSQFTSKQEMKPNDVDEIYQLTYIAENIKQDITSYNISDCSKEIIELLDKFNEMLLDACKQLVMDVSVDIFCAWSEFEENDKTMQQVIGELCHKLRTKLMSISSLSEHPLVSMIQQISRKPDDIKDLINSTDVAVIVEKINNKNEESQQWLHALINKDQLCSHIELLDIINSNIEYFSEDQCLKLYEILISSLENKNYTDTLAVKAFHHCNMSVKHELLDKQFVANRLLDMEETAEFGQMMIETFNKFVIQPDADVSDVLTLFLQNPKQVYYKIFNLGIENPQQTEIMLKVVRLLERYTNHYYETEIASCIITVTQKTFEHDLETNEKQNNFIKFIGGLKCSGIFPGSKLLLIFVMPNLHKALVNENINAIYTLIKLLSDIYTLEELIPYRAPMLAMLAQVLNVVRWNLHSFTPLSPATLQSAICLQQLLIETYNSRIPDNDSVWLKNKLKKTSYSTNLYYYRHLWRPPGRNFFEVITGLNLSNMDIEMEDISTYISRLLALCTLTEWCQIWDSLSSIDDLKVLTMFHEAVLIISLAEITVSNPNTWQCLLYCCRNLIYIIRYKFFKEPLTNEQVIPVLTKIPIFPAIRRGNSEEVESLLLPLLSYLVEKQNDYTYDLRSCEYLKSKNIADVLDKILVGSSV